MFGYNSATWKLAPSYLFIGWTPGLLEKNLPLVVDRGSSSCPGSRSPNICSHLLAIVRRRLPGDWTERYGTTPVLVETPCNTGAEYRASGWIRVGTTQGRGRYDRYTKRAHPKRTSGSVLSEKNGSQSSTAKAYPPLRPARTVIATLHAFGRRVMSIKNSPCHTNNCLRVLRHYHPASDGFPRPWPRQHAHES